ncbi:MAG: PhoH family protein, partial [Sedimentibacter sp.]|uniref:PhoH family protein n=1 Tax=Sedimentibacter sp. TaxID=1960295 RepID=UPI002981A074
MKKTYVLDTNVLIQSPASLLCFEENNLVLPIVCLEELDKLKTENGECGSNARACIRFLEKLRQEGNLLEGVPLSNGGCLRIESNYINIELPPDFLNNKNDNRILQVCRGLRENGVSVILVTKDILVRLKSQILGIEAQDFTNEQAPSLDEQYTGRNECFVSDEAMTSFKKKGICLEDVYTYVKNEKKSIFPVINEFYTLRSETNSQKTLLAKFDGNKFISLNYSKKQPFGITPKNLGQYFLQEALMETAKKAPLVIIKGTAGTAKTFYSLAVGLAKTLDDNDKEYRRILITRPNVQFDENIGFLPGTEQEKIAPFLRPIIDNLEILMKKNKGEKYQDEPALKSKIDKLFESSIYAEAMNFIRGRTLTHTYLIIDEAQNLTPKQAKGIITRVGEGTKVILLGEPQQIDHPLLDERTNGLSYASEKMKGS